MFGILARLLELLYSFWPNYGGSIILFTVVVMLILAPLTFKSTRSMLAMQAMQPEMKKLQNRYKDDRQKLNEEMMKFYQENKISPLGGCLPMFIQFPVFFILYAVLLGLTKRGPFGGDLGYSMACTMAETPGSACTSIGTYAHAGYFHPAYISHTSRLYEDLSITRVMHSFGLDLSQSAWGQFAGGILHALPYLLMVLVVMALTYLQQQQIQRRQPKTAEQNPTQQMMMKVMPVAMGFVYIVIPAGVVVYFLVSSLFRIGQQAMVTRTFYSGPNAVVIPATATEASAGPKEKRSFWDQFKPPESSRPQVGKEAKQQRAESFQSAKSGGAKKASSSSKPGSSQKSGSKANSKAASQNNRPATKKQADSPPKPKSKPKSAEPNVKDASTEAPSRKAPTRQAPQAPSSGSKKKKR